eukprot:m.209472 g.209472  ORF g.209472 m.209472 type:complete len:126 (+) comp10725_c5_seq2:17-394(+)
MAGEAAEMTNHLGRIEALAEEILLARQQIVDMDRRHNSNREALAQMRRHRLQHADKVWMNFGDVFLKLPRDTCQKLIEQEQASFEDETKGLRAQMQTKARMLAELEGGQLSEGWGLTGMHEREFS